MTIEPADGIGSKWRRRTKWRSRQEDVSRRNLAYEICVVPCYKHTYVFETCFVCFGLYAVLS